MHDRQPLAALLRKLRQHAYLGERDADDLFALPVTTRSIAAGGHVIREGDRPTDCAVLLSGFTCRHKVTQDGARQIVAVQIPGDLIDVQHLYLDVADHNVQTLTQAEVAFVPRTAMQDLAARNPEIGRAINIGAAVEASIFREWVVNVGRRDGRGRIAHLLCEFALRMNAQGLSDGQAYDLPMTQEQIGDATGLTSVHVNRMVRSLEADGLITRDKRSVRFPDITALREVAGFNARYLHAGEQAISRRPLNA
jgi:CRP-like cAMP-binding protein